jgi:hypothetical protein
LGKDKEPAWLEVPKEELEELIVWGLAWKWGLRSGSDGVTLAAGSRGPRGLWQFPSLRRQWQHGSGGNLWRWGEGPNSGCVLRTSWQIAWINWMGRGTGGKWSAGAWAGGVHRYRELWRKGRTLTLW